HGFRLDSDPKSCSDQTTGRLHTVHAVFGAQVMPTLRSRFHDVSHQHGFRCDTYEVSGEQLLRSYLSSMAQRMAQGNEAHQAIAATLMTLNRFVWQLAVADEYCNVDFSSGECTH